MLKLTPSQKPIPPQASAQTLQSCNRPYPYVPHHEAQGLADSTGSSYFQRPQADATRNWYASQHRQLFDMLILYLIACDLILFPTLSV